MPLASFAVSTVVKAPPDKTFAYIADLTRHGEWSADPVRIISLTPGPVRVGSRYRSEAQSHGVTFSAELEVTEFEPGVRFGFAGEDATGKFKHLFTLQPRTDGTLVRRRIQFNANLVQWLVFFIVLYPVRIPSAKRTLQRLKDRLETRETLQPPGQRA